MGSSEISRLCRRYEIAVENFGRSCMSMRANEAAFQAWYAAAVIQEFGLARVYREIHLWQRDLLELAGSEDLAEQLGTGAELFPDLSVSWLPDIDARHSSTRDESVRSPGRMLHEFAIVSEFKVTGSTKTPTSPKMIRRDLAKLAVFAAAHRRAAPHERPLATYMVVLDNHTNPEGSPRPHYGPDRMSHLLEVAAGLWDPGVTPPTVIALRPNGSQVVVDTYRKWTLVDSNADK